MNITHRKINRRFGVTEHALARFVQRIMLVHPEFDATVDSLSIMEKSFSYALKYVPVLEGEKAQRHDARATYYKNRYLSFICIEERIVTVEIFDRVKRGLNYIPLRVANG